MILQGKNLSFSYHPDNSNKPMIDDFNICLDTGEFVGLLGKSGRGKSTIGKLLSGYLTPQKGEILLHGSPLPSKGFCPVQLIYQHPEQAVNPHFTIKQILEESGGISLEEVGLPPDFYSRYPHQLSGGQLQRVCIARALTPHTQCIIADEMTTMLDAITQVEIWDFFTKYCQNHGIPVLVITHNKHLAEKVCHRVVELS